MPYSPLAAGHLARPVWGGESLRSKTDAVAKGKYDRTKQMDLPIVERVQEIVIKHGATMSQIALAWEWAKGVASPIVGTTKPSHLEDSVKALDVAPPKEEIRYLKELYYPHPIVGAIKENPPQGVLLLDKK